MTASRLPGRSVERIWGDPAPPAWARADAAGAEPIGEIWFEEPAAADSELLVKFLFTSDKLSIQVHPDDDAARAMGLPRGKSEAWYVYDAEPGATIGAGLVRSVSKDELRAASLDGSIERLLHWRPVAKGDFLYSPAGLIHAIGPGLSLIEIQQNLDLTYRFYDYGRPRALQLDQALAAADASLQPARSENRPLGDGRMLLQAGGAFVVERWTGKAGARIAANGLELTLIPLAEGGTVDGDPLRLGSIWRVDDSAALELEPVSDLLVAYPGPTVVEEVLGWSFGAVPDRQSAEACPRRADRIS
jgi:mannose-6-phosphate isomerase